MNKNKLNKIKTIIQNYISDCEVRVEDINPIGYHDYEYIAYPIVNVDKLIKEIEEIVDR